jgi:hypothetical protein
LTFTTVNGYNTGYVDVYLNGIRLVETVDFTAIDGQTVTLTQGADVDDVLLVQTYYATNSTTVTSANLVITGTVNLGQVSNISISGGSAGQYLVSNGTNGLPVAPMDKHWSQTGLEILALAQQQAFQQENRLLWRSYLEDKHGCAKHSKRIKYYSKNNHTKHWYFIEYFGYQSYW